MASTPEDPADLPDDESAKLELPSVGGLLGKSKKKKKSKKKTRPVEAEQPEETTVEQEQAPLTQPEPEPEETQPVPVPVARAEQEPDPSRVDWDDDPVAEQERHDHGPDLVAPEAAYEADEPAAPAAKTRRLPAMPSMPSMPSRPSLPTLPSLPELTLPLLDTRIAAAVTGAVVGLTGVLLVYVFQLGCGAIRGAGSCGSAGLLLLIAALIAMVFEGAALLKAWYFDDPLTTSFLGVALIAVSSMLFLLPVIDRWFMVLVIPLLSAGFFWLSWFVTSRFDAPEQEAARERENAR